MVSAMVACFGRCGVSAVDPADPDVVYAEVGLPADTEVGRLRDSSGVAGCRVAGVGGGVPEHAVGPSPAGCGFRSCSAGSACTRPRPPCCDVELTRTGVDTFRLHAVDPAGAPVISIDTVTLRAVPEHRELGARPGGAGAAGDSVFELAWLPLPDDGAPAPAVPEWVVCSEDPDRAAGRACAAARSTPSWPLWGRARSW